MRLRTGRKICVLAAREQSLVYPYANRRRRLGSMIAEMSRRNATPVASASPSTLIPMTSRILRWLAPLASLALASLAHAAPLTTKFSDYPGAPTSYGAVDLDTTEANTWFNEHYGITFEHTYMYFDEQDTFDSVGVALDYSFPLGSIFFADGTNFVTIDWVTLVGEIFLNVYDGNNLLVDSFHGMGDSGTVTLNGTDIRRLTLGSAPEQVGISTLSFDYDGVTDGQNTDTGGGGQPSVPGVPDSGTTLGLLAGAFGLLAALRHRR